MIFPSEAVQEARRELSERLQEGNLPSADELERMLAADPEGFLPLFLLTSARQNEGNLEAAEALARRGFAAHPCSPQFAIALASVLTVRGTDPHAVAGWMELAVRKMLADPESLDNLPPATLPEQFADSESLRRFAGELGRQLDSEPAEAAAQIRPYRLIHELQEALGNQLDRGLVDRILEHGPECRPLLLGVLRGLVEGYLPEGGEMMGEAALALLGEIGDPASLRALLQFSMVEEKGLSDVASWAVHRVATRHPAAALEIFRDFDRRAGGGERAAIAEALATMPAAPGKSDVALALFENFGSVAPEERGAAFMVIASALIAIAGKAAPSLIRGESETLGRLLPPDAQAEVKKLLKAYAADPSAFDLEPEEEPEATVYDICCSDRIEQYEDDEEDEDEEHVHGPDCEHGHAGPGRNDPCWCGSGKKYKKCHLAEDEAARLAPPEE